MGLEGRRVVVLGAAGEIGEGVCRALLADGATVVAVSRSPERLDALSRLLDGPDRLETVPADVGTSDGAAPLATTLGSYDGVVAALGGWSSGPPVTSTDAAVWDGVLANGLGAHVRAAQALLPPIADREGASYVLVNGSGAEQPVAGSGAANVSAAGQLMLGRVLALEHADRAVRVQVLLVGTPVVTRSRRGGRPGWLTGDEVGRAVSDLVSGASGRTDAVVRIPESPAG